MHCVQQTVTKCCSHKMLQSNVRGKVLTLTVNSTHIVVYTVCLRRGLLISAKLKNLRVSAFSSLAPDLLRPLMQIESIAIFQLEYLRRNHSPTCHNRALKTTDDADDGENCSCARGQEIRGCQKF